MTYKSMLYCRGRMKSRRFFWLCLLVTFAAEFPLIECCTNSSVSPVKTPTVAAAASNLSPFFKRFQTSNQSIPTDMTILTTRATTIEEKSPQSTELSYSPSSNSPSTASSSNPYSHVVNKFSYSNNGNDHTNQQLSIPPENLQPNDENINFLESILEPEPYFKMLQPDDNYQKQTENSDKKKPDVSVTIYHHQGIHDPVTNYGNGKPWNFLGNGYGLHYGYDLDGKYSRQKGYNFVKAHGRDFCKEGHSCSQNKAAASESSETKPLENTLQKHILNVLKNDNFDVDGFFGKEGQERQRKLSANEQQPKDKQDSVYSFATDKSSPVLTRPTTAVHTHQQMNTIANVYQSPPLSQGNDEMSNSLVGPSSSNVYPNWPKAANGTTFPMAVITTTTTTRKPKKLHFNDDEERDFDAMFNAARDNQYGKRPVKTATVWQSPVRTIYGQAANEWKPVERQLYPNMISSSNVYLSPLRSSVEYATNYLRQQQQVMNSERDVAKLARSRVPNANNPYLPGRKKPLKHRNISPYDGRLARPHERRPLLSSPGRQRLLWNTRPIHSGYYPSIIAKERRSQWMEPRTKPRTPQTPNPYSP